MGVYIIGAIASLWLLYCSERAKIERNRKILVVIALLLPCTIAGCRDSSIGSDVRIYVMPLFLNAKFAETFEEFYYSYFSINDWSTYYVKDFEIGFIVLCYLIAKVFGNLQMLLFAIQALTVIPIYKGLRAFAKRQPVWIGMAVYYFLFYNQTLNMMRQWIAMAFLLYAFQFWVSKKYRKCFLILVVATLFHYTAILGVFPFAIYRFTTSNRASNNRWGAMLLIALCIAGMLSLDLLVKLLNWLGLDYDHYISGTLQIMPRQIYYRIPIILLLLWRWKYLKRNDPCAWFYVVMLAYDLMLSQLTSIFSQSGRIGLYFCEYYILAYPALCAASKSKKNKRIMQMVVLCFLMIYWLYVYGYGNSSSTVPYISCFATV